jgi:hypothetical protein
MLFGKPRLKKFSNQKLVKRLTDLLNETPRNQDKIAAVRAEVGKRDPQEYAAAEIEVVVEKYRRHIVMETLDILYKELEYCDKQIAKPETENNKRERAAQITKREVVVKEIARKERLGHK